MVSAVYTVHVLPARVVASQSQCEVIGLGARVDKKNGLQLRRHRVCDGLGQPHYVVVEVAAVGIEYAQLCRRRLYHSRVRVTDVAHVVDAVKIPSAILVVQILTGTWGAQQETG